MLLNNTINLSLIILNIILYYFPFIEYLWVCKILLVLIGLKSTEKFFAHPFNAVLSYYYLQNLLDYYLDTVYNL